LCLAGKEPLRAALMQVGAAPLPLGQPAVGELVDLTVLAAVGTRHGRPLLPAPQWAEWLTAERLAAILAFDAVATVYPSPRAVLHFGFAFARAGATAFFGPRLRLVVFLVFAGDFAALVGQSIASAAHHLDQFVGLQACYYPLNLALVWLACGHHPATGT